MTAPLTIRIVAGFGRSGTTWIQDVMASANSLRPVFEPLNPQVMRGAESHAHRYLCAEDDDSALYAYLQRYLEHDFHSLWVDYRIIRRRLVPKLNNLRSIRGLKRVVTYNLQARDNILRFRKQRRHEARIVKFVRANMMLAWLQKNFEARIVFVIRHPAAVVLSQLQAPQSWNPRNNIELYRADRRLVDTLEVGLKGFLFKSLDDIETHALSWCVENFVALRQAQNCGIPIVCYENLVTAGDTEWRRILSALDLRSMPSEELIQRPSQQAWGPKATDPRLVRQHDSWKKRARAETLNRIQSVLDMAEIDLYNVREAMPTRSI